MAPTEVTRLLDLAREGNATALQRVYALVYEELRRVARAQLREQRRGTLDTGALINESYIKLVKEEGLQAKDRAHLLALSARAMRQILVDHFRRGSAAKRGGSAGDLPLNEDLVPGPARGEQLLALEVALVRLTRHNRRLAEVVECKFFGGMSYEEIAEALDVAPRTVRRDWFKAKAWLTLALSNERDAAADG